jgi:hypothetical protein
MDVLTAMGRQWKHDGNGYEWLGDGWPDGNGNGWLGDGRLGNGWLGNGLRKGLAKDGVTTTPQWWNDPAAMDDLMATAMNGSAMDGSSDGRRDGLVMDGFMATRRWWTSWRGRDVDGSATAMAMAVNGLVMDGSAMDGARAWLWLARRQR